jgi:hypothetical protein
MTTLIYKVRVLRSTLPYGTLKRDTYHTDFTTRRKADRFARHQIGFCGVVKAWVVAVKRKVNL